jgi:hypothetical protein
MSATRVSVMARRFTKQVPLGPGDGWRRRGPGRVLQQDLFFTGEVIEDYAEPEVPWFESPLA